MNLNRQGKTGTIKNIDSNGLKVAVASIGTIMICVGITCVIEKGNRKYDYSPEYEYYSDQLEKQFEIDLTSEQEIMADRLEDMNNLVLKYEVAISSAQKENVVKEIEESSTDLEEISLRLVKEKFAKEHGGNWSDYVISNQEYSNVIPVWSISSGEDTTKLSGVLFDTVNSIANVQSARENLSIDNEKSGKKLVESYQDLLRKTAKLMTKMAKQTK